MNCYRNINFKYLIKDSDIFLELQIWKDLARF